MPVQRYDVLVAKARVSEKVLTNTSTLKVSQDSPLDHPLLFY